MRRYLFAVTGNLRENRKPVSTHELSHGSKPQIMASVGSSLHVWTLGETVVS